MTTSLKKAPEVASPGLSLCVPLGYNLILACWHYKHMPRQNQVFPKNNGNIKLLHFRCFCLTPRAIPVFTVYALIRSDPHIVLLLALQFL